MFLLFDMLHSTFEFKERARNVNECDRALFATEFVFPTHRKV